MIYRNDIGRCVEYDVLHWFSSAAYWRHVKMTQGTCRMEWLAGLTVVLENRLEAALQKVSEQWGEGCDV